MPHGCRWPVIGAKVDTELRELTWKLHESAGVKFIDLGTEDGMRFYRRTGILVLVMAAREVLQGCRVLIKHSLSNGLYGEIKWRKPLTEAHVRSIEERMREIVEANKPIVRKRMLLGDAIELFRADGNRTGAPAELTELPTMLTSTSAAGSAITTTATWRPALATSRASGSGTTCQASYWSSLRFIRLSRSLDGGAGEASPPYYESERWGRLIGVTDIASSTP